MQWLGSRWKRKKHFAIVLFNHAKFDFVFSQLWCFFLSKIENSYLSLSKWRKIKMNGLYIINKAFNWVLVNVPLQIFSCSLEHTVIRIYAIDRNWPNSIKKLFISSVTIRRHFHQFTKFRSDLVAMAKPLWISYCRLLWHHPTWKISYRKRPNVCKNHPIGYKYYITQGSYHIKCVEYILMVTSWKRYFHIERYCSIWG